MHPIFLVIVSFFILGLIINNSLVTREFQKRRMTLAFVNVFAWGTICIVYDKYIVGFEAEVVVFVYAILTFILFGIQLYLSFRTSMLRANHYQLFIDSIKNTRFNVYYVIDEKERIKDMSASLLEEIGLSFEEVRGKKIFDVFDKTIRFTRFNDTEVNNKSIREYYKTYRDNIKEGVTDKREIVFQNFEGKSLVLNMIEQPVYVFKKYKGRMCIGEKKSDATLLTAERELKESIKELQSIRYKFIATLEITEESLFYLDLDQKYIWGTDNFKNMLGLEGNTIGIEDYRNLIHSEDLVKYNKVMENIKKEDPNYQINYRFKQGDRYIWIKERGKRIFEDENANVILAFVKKMENSRFEKTGIADLDNVLNEIELLADVTKLYETNRTFELLAFRLSNIPEINEKHGRSVGNMMIGEYVKKIKQNFKSENSDVYRIGGIDFIVTITDPRRMEMLKRTVAVEKAPLNIVMEYGGISETVVAKSGIAISSSDAEEAKALIGCARYALRFACDENYAKDCCYYRDVR